MRYLALAILVLVLISYAGCGSSGELSPDEPAVPALADADALTGDEHRPVVIVKESFRLEVLAESFSLGGTADFSLSVNRSPGGTEAIVTAQADGLKACYLALAYDAHKLHPVDSETGSWPGQESEQLLSLTVLDTPGAVHHGTVVMRPQACEGVIGSFTPFKVRFAEGPAAVRQAAAVPDAPASRVPDLLIDQGTGETTFSYVSQGDYDQNGEVNISDLTPLGLHFGEVSPLFPAPFPFETIGSVVDGNTNGEVEIADVTPIGQHFTKKVTEWRIYGGDAADYPQAASDGNGGAALLGTVAFNTSTTVPSAARLTYAATIAALTTFSGQVLWVRPVGDETDEGIASDWFAYDPVYETTWRIETVAPIIAQAGPTSLALSQGVDPNPHVGYLDVDTSSVYGDTSTVYCARKTGGTWVTEPIETLFGFDVFTGTGLALDSADGPHLVYINESSAAPVLRHSYLNSGSWEAETLETGQSSSGDDANYFIAPSLAIDSSDQLHVAWNDEYSFFPPGFGPPDYDVKIHYGWQEGGGWHRDSVATSGGPDEPPTIAHFNPLRLHQDAPRMCYFDSDPSGTLFYASKVGGWQAEQIGTGVDASAASLALDPATGNPHVAFVDGGLVHAYHDGSQWHSEMISGSANVGPHVSIVLNAAGHPRVCYYSADTADLMYGFYDGAAWYLQGVDTAGDVGRYCSLAYSAGSDRLAVSYVDVTSGDVKYAELM